MTPAVQLLKKQKIAYELHRFDITDDEGEGYGVAAAKALGVDPSLVFKTLLVSFNGDPKNLGVCILPVSHTLNLKKAAKAHGQKSALMADPTLAEKATGYVVGGISPLGQKKRLPMVLDESAEGFEFIYVSGGKRGLDLKLAPSDLLKLTQAVLGDLVN